MNKTQTPSAETEAEAMKIARASQKPGQTKEQTKLIAQGIAKGIAQYKKQQKERNRKADKAKKQAKKARAADQQDAALATPAQEPQATQPSSSRLPWGLLAISWIAFIALWVTVK